MKPSERYEWIEDWMRRGTTLSGQLETVDVLHRYFVDDYTEATGAKFVVKPFGANHCPQLGRDLTAMFKLGILTRYATGLGPGDAAMGFPKWVYVYEVKAAHNIKEQT